MSVRIFVLMAVSLFGLLGCQASPPTPAETAAHQRFMTGCRHSDAFRDPDDFETYCSRF